MPKMNEIKSEEEKEVDGALITEPVAPAAEMSKEEERLDPAEVQTMTVIEHLEELRQRLIRSLLIFSVALAGCLVFAPALIRILEQPAGNMKFQALSIEEPVIVCLKVAFYASLVVCLPYLLWEISQFIYPGLKKKEREVLTPIILGGPLLFFTGAVFAYFYVLPPMLSFFSSFGQAVAPVHQRLDFYISMVLALLFYMGLCFQLPVVLFALSLTGIVNSGHLLKVWKYAVFASSVVAAVITPDPTVVSMLIVTAALIGLYFLTIILLKISGR